MADLKNNVPQLKAYSSGLHISDTQNADLQTAFSAVHHMYNLYLRVQYGLLDVYYKLYPTKAERDALSAKERRQFFISNYEFQKVFNKYIRNCKYESNEWLKGVASHTLRDAFKNAETAFKRYFKGIGGHPHYQGGNSKRSCYFDNVTISKTSVRLPKIGQVKLHRYHRFPTTTELNAHGYHVVSAHVKEIAGRYYVSVVTNEPQQRNYLKLNDDDVLGIDLGIKDFVILSNKMVFGNITSTKYKTPNIANITTKNKVEAKLSDGTYYLHLENHLKRVQRKMDRRRVAKEKGKRRIVTNRYKKARRQYQRVWRRISMFMDNYIQQITSQIVNLRCSRIALEDLNVKGMKKNHKLAPSIQKLPFYKFKTVLIWKCKKAGIEVVDVPRFYASSRYCSNCGEYNDVQFTKGKPNLKTRTFKCPYCKTVIDRDLNAANNIANYRDYTVLTSKQQDYIELNNVSK